MEQLSKEPEYGKVTHFGIVMSGIRRVDAALAVLDEEYFGEE